MTLSLNLRAILKSAVTRCDLGLPGRTVTGLPGAAKALYVAAGATTAPVILVVPSDREVEEATQDIQFFLAGLEGWTPAEAGRRVLPFPSHQVDPYRGLRPHFDILARRGRALHGLASGNLRALVASVGALLPRLSPPSRFARASMDLAPGVEVSPTDLGDLLADAGFTWEDPVDAVGEFCVRGGVIDIYPAGEPQPLRLEFIGDTIESIRRFDPATQRSIATLDRASVVPVRDVFDDEDDRGQSDDDRGSREASVFDYLESKDPSLVFMSEQADVWAHATRLIDQVQASHGERTEQGETLPAPETFWFGIADLQRWLAHATSLEELEIDELETDEPDAAETVTAVRRSRHVSCQPAIDCGGRISDWVSQVQQAHGVGEAVLFVAETSGRAERTVEVLQDHDVIAWPIDRVEDTRSAAVLVTTGQLTRGFRLPEAALQIFAETDVFGEERRPHERRQSVSRIFLSDFRDLKVGDLVVHIDHGIGLFAGLRQIDVDLAPQEFMELRYAGEDKLYVPVERLDLVQKYTGAARPALDKLGGATWERAKTKVRRAMRDMAEELLRLYAARRAMPGHAFSPDSHWQHEFDDAFEYELTPDQLAAIADIKRDMEAPMPMDRLLCGDVGYGKTEVAMRAAFKAVMDGKQVALLAPTTVLAFQHLKTLRDRFAAFPMRVDMVSRFRTRAEQKEIVADLAAGKVDVIVGTHRLLSKDVQFRDLGLLVVDEEQRFGVVHKERLKQLRRRVDVLTLTATPIPRTLNMSLVGIRDMSVIETPPKDRLSIQTNVVKFDQRIIERAIRNELERNGQVYFVHNRVESIFSIGNLLQRLVPEARIGIGHGQMAEEALERVMVDFVDHKYDVLLATTIIENGLDIPNANTLIVNRADRYGLAQIYQLRGRVGRSDRRAYAYLAIPSEESLSPVARKRLAAIREFSDLGSGFRIAALDLEIRGAGNLLGGQQSGHIEAVGFEMYTKLLEQTIRELKGEELEDEPRATVNLKVDLRIDDAYIPDMNQRLGVYRKIASARDLTRIRQVADELKDRYGEAPRSVENLIAYATIRVTADRLRLESIDREGRTAVLKFRPDTPVDPSVLLGLVHTRDDLRFLPPATLRLDLQREGVPARSTPGAPRRGRAVVAAGERSWWTARATASAVTPGFTKADMLRPAAEDPRAPGGVFERVAGLLDLLSPAGDPGQ